MKKVLLLFTIISSVFAQDDVFVNNLPKLTKEQIEIYRESWPIIINYLDNPNNFYATSITKIEDTSCVEISQIYSLRKLKVPICKNDSQAVVLRFNDARYPRKFYFRKNSELIKYYDSYNKLYNVFKSK